MLPGGNPSKGPFETRTSIGRRCKVGNHLSRAVLIAREAWPSSPLPIQTTCPHVSSKALVSRWTSRRPPAPDPAPTLTHPYCRLYGPRCTREPQRDRPVIMARGPHPFPFRTRSLSLAARMVLPGKPGGRVRRHRPPLHESARLPLEAGRFSLAAHPTRAPSPTCAGNTA